MEEKEVIKTEDPYKKIIRALFILSTIFSAITILYFIFPIVSLVVCVIIVFIVLIIIVATAVFSLFIACASEDYRKWVGDIWNGSTSLFNNTNDLINKIMPYFTYSVCIAGVFNVIVIVFASIQRFKLKKGYLVFIILTSIFFVLNVVMAILYYSNGMNLVGA